MKTGAIYSASDKALFDALTQHAVTQAALRQIFIKRGIIVSHDTPRDTLALYFSRLVHDYDDFQSLARMFGTHHRRERMASFRVVSKAKISDFESAAHAVIEQITQDGNSASVDVMDDGTVKISVRYKKFHFDKNEFKQVATKDAVITVEQDKGAVVVRAPQNNDVDDWCRQILSHVEGQINAGIDIDEIDLESVTAPEARSKFFMDLINSVPGFKKYDVTDVYVFKPKLNNGQQSIDDEDEDKSSESVDLGVHISRASLKGEGVLESEEFKGLTQKGFYISKIVWQAKHSHLDSDIYEFEAQFTEPETCTKFSYLPRGFYKYMEPKVYGKSKSQFTTEEDRELSKLIELAARDVISKIATPTVVANDHGKE